MDDDEYKALEKAKNWEKCLELLYEKLAEAEAEEELERDELEDRYSSFKFLVDVPYKRNFLKWNKLMRQTLKRKMKPDEGTLRHKLFNVVDVRCSKALRHRPEPPTTYAEAVKAIKKWYQIEETHQKKDNKKALKLDEKELNEKYYEV